MKPKPKSLKIEPVLKCCLVKSYVNSASISSHKLEFSKGTSPVEGTNFPNTFSSSLNNTRSFHLKNTLLGDYDKNHNLGYCKLNRWE